MEIIISIIINALFILFIFYSLHENAVLTFKKAYYKEKFKNRITTEEEKEDLEKMEKVKTIFQIFKM